MPLPEYQARTEDPRLTSEWEFRIPTPEGAQKWLREGWERDEIDGRPVVAGGTLEKPAHWGVRRRLAGKEPRPERAI